MTVLISPSSLAAVKRIVQLEHSLSLDRFDILPCFVVGVDFFFFFFWWQIEQEKLASLKKIDDDKKEKENKDRAQSKSPKR